MGWSPRCYIPSFVEISACRFWRRRFLKGFYHIWAWRPSWSCDPDAANKLSFPLPNEAPHKIWLWLAKRFQRRRCLKLWTTDGRRTTDGRTPDHGYTISSPLSLRLRWAKKAAIGIANSEDPDQTAPLGAVWSGSALFALTDLSENLRSLQYIMKECSLITLNTRAYSML